MRASPRRPRILLRSHVIGGADGVREPGPGEPPLRLEECDAEVDDLHLALCRDQDVLRLDVPVDDPVCLEVRQRIADLAGQGQRLLHRHGVLPHHRAERPTLDVLHGEVRSALLSRLQDPDHVGVIELLPDLLLPPESLGEDDVALVLEVGDLQGHGGAGEGILRLEDGRHAAARQELLELVLVETVAGYGFRHGTSEVSMNRRQPSVVRRQQASLGCPGTVRLPANGAVPAASREARP